MNISQETRDFILNIAEGLLEEDGKVQARDITDTILFLPKEIFNMPPEFKNRSIEDAWQIIDIILSNANTIGKFKAKHNVHTISVYTKN